MMKKFVLFVALLLLILASSLSVMAQPTRNQWVIGSEAPLTAEQVAAIEAAGANVGVVYENFGGASAQMSPRAANAVRALPFVTSVTEDSLKQLDYVGTPPALPNAPYWLDLMDAEDNPGYTGAGVWVAVLDSGFYPNWRDYFNEDQILTEYGVSFNGNSGVANFAGWASGSDPHGMAVAATIIGHRFVDDFNEGGWPVDPQTATGGPALAEYYVPGVAPEAQIIPIQVCIPIGCFGSAINAAVDYVTSLKLANPSQPIVINASLGGPGIDPVEKAAIDAAVSAGVVYVASAGNSGLAGMGFPGAYEPVISVAAGGWVDQFSNYPDKTWWLNDAPENDISEIFVANFSSRQLAGQYLDVTGPGRFVLLPYPCTNLYTDGQVSNRTINKACASKASPNNSTSQPYQYLFMSGTSFSAPAIAGVVALMLEKDPTLSNADIDFSGSNIAEPSTWQSGELEQLLESIAVPVPPIPVEVNARTGGTQTENIPNGESDGAGWIYIDDALNAVP